MTDVVLRPTGGMPDADLSSDHGVDLAALETALHNRVDGEVRFDAGARGAYATDASNYRQVPIAVVVPRTVDAGAATVAVCREHGAPLLSRGAGTSLAGQCTNTSVVIDWTKYCHRLVSVDAAALTCVVEPGIVRLLRSGRELRVRGGAPRVSRRRSMSISLPNAAHCWASRTRGSRVGDGSCC